MSGLVTRATDGYQDLATLRRVWVEISVVEQRYQAVLAVRAGAKVTGVAERFGVCRQDGWPG